MLLGSREPPAPQPEKRSSDGRRQILIGLMARAFRDADIPARAPELRRRGRARAAPAPDSDAPTRNSGRGEPPLRTSRRPARNRASPSRALRARFAEGPAPSP